MTRHICATVLYSTYEDEREEPSDNGGPVQAFVAVTTTSHASHDPNSPARLWTIYTVYSTVIALPPATTLPPSPSVTASESCCERYSNAFHCFRQGLRRRCDVCLYLRSHLGAIWGLNIWYIGTFSTCTPSLIIFSQTRALNALHILTRPLPQNLRTSQRYGSLRRPPSERLKAR